MGYLLADMMHPKVCCSWIFDRMGPEEKNRFTKRYPAGAQPPKEMSQMIGKLQQSMCKQVPGHRPSLYQVCQELLALAKKNPMPHPFWNHPTVMPDGPPKQKEVSAEQAANIAGSSGYAVGSQVLVLIDGAWLPGVVDFINHTVCPGAVHVQFTKGQGEKHKTLIMPWIFQECLRPNPQGIAPTAGQSKQTDTPRSRGSGQKNGKGKEPAEDQNAGKKKKCCVVM